MIDIAVLFPGSGAHYTGMGKTLYNNYPEARAVFDEADDTLGFALTRLCFQGKFDKLSKYAQLAIFTMSIAAYRTFVHRAPVKVKYLAGHSLGEYTSLVAAEALGFAAGLLLVRRRNELMYEFSQRADYSMLAINNMTVDELQAICADVFHESGDIYLSIINSESHCLVSASRVSLAQLTKKLSGTRAEVIDLPVETPSHSILMRTIAEEFTADLQHASFTKPSISVISNTTGKPYEAGIDISSSLKLHMMSPLNWLASMRYLLGEGISTFVEVGPQSILKNIFVAIDEKVKVLSTDVKDDLEHLFNLSSDDSANDELLKQLQVAIIAAPNYNFSITEHEELVARPYRLLIETITASRNDRTTRIKRADVIRLAREILLAKRLEPTQVDHILRQVLAQTRLVE